MPVVSIFSGTFCRAEEVIEALQQTTGYRILTDADIINRASEVSSISCDRLNRCFSAKASIFNPFTRELERSLSWIKLVLAEYLQATEFILHGYTGHLIPSSISHAIHTCLIAPMPYRIRDCVQACNIDREEAAKRISESDAHKTGWIKLVKGKANPWDPTLYDMVLPTDTHQTEFIVNTIQRGLKAPAVAPTASTRDACSVFLQEARIEAALAKNGHVAHVKNMEDHIILTIDRQVMMIDRLKAELESIVKSVSNVSHIELKVTPAPGNSEAYRKYSQERPSKVLLVDDEREFVQTLSERLEMRDIGSVIAFDGERALDILADDKPEVMLLDLQMPGINGIDVLKKTRETHPEIEVIILTGHGTHKDRALCMALGAFAYLEKPVDIDILSKTLKQANEKMRKNVGN